MWARAGRRNGDPSNPRKTRGRSPDEPSNDIVPSERHPRSEDKKEDKEEDNPSDERVRMRMRFNEKLERRAHSAAAMVY